MDQFQSFPIRVSAALSEASGVRSLADKDVSASRERVATNKAALSLVSGRLLLASSSQPVPGAWKDAIDQLAQALEIDVGWIADDQPPSLIQKARRVVGSDVASQAPIYSPWRIISPTALQMGQSGDGVTGAHWVASYLFDFGRACASQQSPVDIALMSPCPKFCVSDDAQIGSLPRLSVLANMMRAAASEGRTNLAVVVQESARATIAARLLSFDASLKDISLDVEFISIEEAVGDIQRGTFDWDAVIAMPDLRGILFAMLAQSSGVAGPWPMLWFGRGLRLITCEALQGARLSSHLDATALIQTLALLARHSGHQYAAGRLYESWAALRGNGVVTAARSSSAPYVNEIDEAAFIERACLKSSQNACSLPNWMGVARGEDRGRTTSQPVHLTLVE